MDNSVSFLKGMFPGVAEDVIKVILQDHNGDADAATDALMQLNINAGVPAAALPVGQLKPAPKASLHDVIVKVCEMPYSEQARAFAKRHGLDIMDVAWEDNARYQNSSVGPCISDMTLQVDGHNLPLVRHPNFEDLTWDVPIDNVNITVGNEVGAEPYSVKLKEYLEHFRLYLHNPSSWAGQQTSLLAPRDTHVLVSAQACFLPVPQGGESNFNVSIFNYQSTARDPAVLAVVVSSQGASAQVIGSAGQSGQKLFFNHNGQRASFVGQRLADNREERGDAAAPAGQMSAEEKRQNVLVILQIPLKRRQVVRPPMIAYACASAPPPMCRRSEKRAVEDDAVDVEDAIIKIGFDEGPFDEIQNLPIERDPAFPIRVTLQFYKATSNGAIDDAVVSTIAAQLKESREKADFVGSLVVQPRAGRPTEHCQIHAPPVLRVPPWWEPFWLTHGSRWPHLNEKLAQEMVFHNGNLADSVLDESTKQRVFTLLNPRAIVHPKPLPIFKTD